MMNKREILIRLKIIDQMGNQTKNITNKDVEQSMESYLKEGMSNLREKASKNIVNVTDEDGNKFYAIPFDKLNELIKEVEE